MGTPRLLLSINDSNVSALLDIAATHSFAKPEYVDQITTKRVSSVALGSNATSMETTGTGIVAGELQGQRIEVPVLIAPNLREDLILGFPWFTGPNTASGSRS
ncbi:hypothetical protein QE152_g41291 [Popillia japonica]|uniref:Uncharacterized protein n=1 Tax=Popillia japonica TaxID=7064 RepID=A0AAW1GWR4_POPJA